MSFAVYRSLQQWRRGPLAASPTAVTVGNFDGLHLGHQRILRRVIELGHAAAMAAVAVTFDPHPARFLRPREAPPLLLTMEQRLAALRELGCDAALVLRFDAALARLAPEEFVRQILLDGLRAQAVVVGRTFRFGHQQAGDSRLLAELGQRLGFAVESVEPVKVRGRVVSSSAIRQALREGRTLLAARWLGRPFALTGKVRPGTGRGRQLVVPTLNLQHEQEITPKPGVYVTETVVGGECSRSVTNIGVRPTFDGGPLSVESHLLDFSGGISAARMEVRFWARLREEKRFASPAALRAQILRDITRARRFLARVRRPASAAGKVP